MKIFLFQVVLLCTLGFFGVYSQSALQLDIEELSTIDHSHGHGPSGGESKSFSGPSAKVRLPKNVLPVHYDLKIIPILDNITDMAEPPEQFTAPGKVTILVKCYEVTDTIWLHKHPNLTIYDPTLTFTAITDDSENNFTAEAELDGTRQLYVIKLDKNLIKGNDYEIYVEFLAPVPAGINNGLYRSSFINPATGETSYLATTQFEAASARQAFPCFDEPGIKATFNITIGYNKDSYIALGNSAEVEGSETPIGDDYPDRFVYQEFQETVPMSVYLVAIVVADFNFTEADPTIYPKPVRIYGAPHLIEDKGGVYSADKAAELLDFFEKRYEIEYHLPKMDSVAVVDFNFGAMENWGLNIYRQEYLLYHEDASTQFDKKRITSVLSHELAHQWFGNSVTTEWWSFIWLNEGFATYNEYVGAAAVNSDYQFDKVYLTENLQVALVSDAIPGQHPLVNPAHENESNDQLMNYFSRITYQKGGAVIWMMEAFLGKETFRKALVNYLKGMEFQAAKQDDLFGYLTKQAHDDFKLDPDVTMKDILDTWTLQSGFPLIRVSRAGTDRIYISQERFVNGGAEYAAQSELDSDNLWYVPLAIATADNPDFTNHTPKLWLEQNILMKNTPADTTKWIIVNPDATGYYRVLYDTALTNLILAQLNLKFDVISDLTRSQLVDDYFQLAAQKYVQIETALEFTRYMANEDSLVVWNPLLVHLRGIFNKLSSTGVFDSFKQYVQPRIEAGLELVGQEQTIGEKGWKVILRATLLDWACALGQSECRIYSKRLFDTWAAAPEDPTKSIPVDLRPVALCGAITHGGFDTYQKAKELYADLVDQAGDWKAEKLRAALGAALGCTQEPSAADELVNDILLPASSSFLEKVDKGPVLEKLAGNPQTRSKTLNFLRNNLEDLFSVIGHPPLARVVGSLATFTGLQIELDAMSELVDPSFDIYWDDSLPTVRAHLNTVRQNIAWRTQYEARLERWFAANK